MIVIKIILWTLLALLILIALALAVPTRVYFRLTDDIFLQVRYLFLKITIPISDKEKEKKPKKKKKPKKDKKAKKAAASEKKASEAVASKKGRKKEKKKKEPNKAVNWLKRLHSKGGVSAIIGAFKRIASLAGNILKPIFTHLKFRELNIDITVASDNAADTAINYGRLCAGVYPALTALLKIIKYDDYSVRIRPDFNKEKLEYDISAEIALVPWIAIGGALHALVRLVIFRVKGEL